MVSRSQHWLHQFQLVTEHSLKGATNYGNCATGVGTKHAVLRSRLRPGPSGLETKTETLAIRSGDRDRDLDKMNSSAFESRDHGLEITTLQTPAVSAKLFHQHAHTPVGRSLDDVVQHTMTVSKVLTLISVLHPSRQCNQRHDSHQSHGTLSLSLRF